MRFVSHTGVEGQMGPPVWKEYRGKHTRLSMLLPSDGRDVGSRAGRRVMCVPQQRVRQPPLDLIDPKYHSLALCTNLRNDGVSMSRGRQAEHEPRVRLTIFQWRDTLERYPKPVLFIKGCTNGAENFDVANCDHRARLVPWNVFYASIFENLNPR